MSEVKVNKISPRTNCGTVQLGDSGDTITIPAGATIVNNGTQTGFGRTGTVNWDTTAKTASFTAVSGNGYFVNTTSGAITVTLPATPSAGDIVSIADYTNTFQTNSVTVARNGSPIGGVTQDAFLTTEGQSVTFVYVDGTEGWKNVQDSTSNVTGKPPFIIATGGTVTCCGNCKVHTFTSPGTFSVTNISALAPNNVLSYMVVAGGGGGAQDRGGGGGAGGFREDKSPVTPYTASPLDGAGSISATVTDFPITIGGGGTGGVAAPGQGAAGRGTPGSNSVFSTITSAGGGGGAPGCAGPTGPSARNALDGGSGGGGGSGNDAGGCGGTGNTPPVTPSQGNDGGNASPNSRAAGGGGATVAGGTSPTGTGGNGATTSINLSSTTFAGGGGGGITSGCAGSGGTGGGGDGASGSCTASAGTVNTGGGGGGGGNPCSCGGAGGSGIVVIRYKYQ